VLCRAMADRGSGPPRRARDGCGWDHSVGGEQVGPLVHVVGYRPPQTVLYTQTCQIARGSLALSAYEEFTGWHSPCRAHPWLVCQRGEVQSCNVKYRL
jgi:hypothetical protein